MSQPVRRLRPYDRTVDGLSWRDALLIETARSLALLTGVSGDCRADGFAAQGKLYALRRLSPGAIGGFGRLPDLELVALLQPKLKQ
ncbi:MAG: hypothetical protein KGH84_15265 [Paracoccaceae bacterium]|nr:hypothetical protein [Paracoccaceae bacterium]